MAAAQYHYLSNRIGGVSVEYMQESDRKAWIRYAPPRWIWHGTAICAVPGEVSRAMLLGWHAHNGVSLGNPRLGFVCTKQTADGDPGLEGDHLEHDRDLAPEERLRFARHEEAPDFDPASAPWVAAADWPAERLRKAHRNYAMEYVRTAIPVAIQLFGPVDAVHLVGMAGRLVGMQFHGEMAACAGLGGRSAADFAAWMAAIARAQGDRVVSAGADGAPGEAVFAQSSWALMRGLPDLHAAGFACWNALWEGALAAHDRRLELVPLRRLDLGDGAFEWRIRPRRRVVTPLIATPRRAAPRAPLLRLDPAARAMRPHLAISSRMKPAKASGVEAPALEADAARRCTVSGGPRPGGRPHWRWPRSPAAGAPARARRPGDDVEPCQPFLMQARHLGHQGAALLAGHPEHAQLPGLHLALRRGRTSTTMAVHPPGDDIGDRRRRGAVGHMDHLHAALGGDGAAGDDAG